MIYRAEMYAVADKKTKITFSCTLRWLKNECNNKQISHHVKDAGI